MYKLEHKPGEAVSHGINTCVGYGLEIVMQNALSAVGDDTILIILPGCAALFSGHGIETSAKAVDHQCNLENVASMTTGAKASLLAQGNDHTTVVGLAGDDAIMDIGIQALSDAMERRDKILYICYDNEAYTNTGTQGSSSTPMFASTITTPAGEYTVREGLVGITMAHDIPYATAASISNPADLRRKVQEVKDIQGPSLIHAHAPCPTGRRYASSKTVEMTGRAVQTGCWALYGYEDGRMTVNYGPKGPKPIEECISLQRCFKNTIENEKVLMFTNTENRFRRLIKRLDDMSA